MPIKLDKAAHVVGDIGETDFDPRAGKPGRSDKEAHQTLLMREQMFGPVRDPLKEQSVVC